MSSLQIPTKTPRARPDLSALKGCKALANKGFQATWLKNPDGFTQGPRWELAVCGTGCKISPGCDICMAVVNMMLAKQNGVKMGPVAPRPENLHLPYKWRQRKNAFCCPEGDLLHDRIPSEFVREVFNVKKDCSQHNFVMTTKREHRLHEIEGYNLPNVFVGVSVESQEYMHRALALVDLPRKFGKVLFAAPMLTPLKIPPKVLKKLDWVVCSPERGGRGRTPRPCPEEWLMDLIGQVKGYNPNLPFFLDMNFQVARIHRMGGKYMEMPSRLFK